jgi:hypothetical protein
MYVSVQKVFMAQLANTWLIIVLVGRVTTM